jgi:putative transposase
MKWNQKSTHYWNIYLDHQIYFFISSIVKFQPILAEKSMKQCILKYWNFYRKKYSILIHGYVIMPDHIRIIIYGDKSLHIQYFIQQSLRSSAIALLKNIYQYPSIKKEPILKIFHNEADSKTTYKVWKEQARGIPLQTENMLEQRLNYIHENPVRKGLAENPLEYRYSSCGNYMAGDHSVFQVDLL